MPTETPRTYSARSSCRSEPPTTSGMFSMIPNAVRSRIARTSRIPILNVLNRPQGVSTSPSNRSRSSSTSSCSTESADTISVGAMSSRYPSTPRSDSPNASDNIQALVPIEGAMQRPGHSSLNLEMACVGYKICAAARNQVYSQNADEATIRKLHIDAIGYLVMALPPDLTMAEIQGLRGNMPQLLLDGRAEPESPSSTSIRRLTAWWTASLLSWMFFVLPLLVAVTNSVLQFWRQHQVTERGWGFLQGFYVGLTTFLAGKQLDMPACGNALGRAMGIVVVWLAGLLGEIAYGMEDGWDRAALGQSGGPGGSVELVQKRAQRIR